jgi:hypothetical protein
MKTFNVTWTCESGISIQVKVYTMTGRESRHDNLTTSAFNKVRMWLSSEAFLTCALSNPVITEESNASD